MASSIKFYVNICDDKPEALVGGKNFSAGFRGLVQVGHKIADDILYIDLEGCGHHPHVGDAKHIESVSIRICKDSVTTIAIYDKPEMTVMGCCHCCANGCCVYGSSGCGCG